MVVGTLDWASSRPRPSPHSTILPSFARYAPLWGQRISCRPCSCSCGQRAPSSRDAPFVRICVIFTHNHTALPGLLLGLAEPSTATPHRFGARTTYIRGYIIIRTRFEDCYVLSERLDFHHLRQRLRRQQRKLGDLFRIQVYILHGGRNERVIRAESGYSEI
jgi:hypothetical protein